MTMQINLTEEEAAMLKEILTNTLSEIRFEISNTERMTFREQIKEREALVKKILDDLAK